MCIYIYTHIKRGMDDGREEGEREEGEQGRGSEKESDT